MHFSHLPVRLTVALVVAACVRSGFAATITWTGAAGPAAASWHTAGNWDLNRVPGVGDDVVIPNVGATTSITYSAGTTDINSVTCSEALILSGGTLNIAAASSITTSFTISGGTRAGAGTLTVSGLFTWSSGALDGGGRTTCNGGMSWAGGTKFFRNHTLDNSANAVWTSGGLQSGQGGVFNNTGSGTLDIQVDETWFYNLGGAAIVFNNAGTVRKTVGAGTNSVGVDMVNTGIVQGNSGTLTFGGNVTSNSSGSFSATAGNSVGFFQSGSGVQNITGTVNGAGTFFCSGGTVNINAPATYASGGTVVNGGTLNVNANGSTGTLGISSGTRGGTGTLTCSGLFTWTGGTIDGGGRTTCNGGMSWAGSTKFFRSHTLDNAGAATWTAGGIQSGQGGVFNNTAAGVFDIQLDETWFYNLGGAAIIINNAGTLKKTAGAGTMNLQIDLNNSGGVQGNSGTLAIGGTVTSNSSGSFSATAGNFVGFAQSGSGIQNITGSVSGAGTFFCSGGTVNANSPTSYNNGGTLVNGGILNLNVNGATGTLGISSGARGGTGTLTCSGLFTWTGGTIDGGGRTTCNSGMSWAGGTKFFRNHTLDNAGAATWTLGGFQSGQGGVFNNTATGVLDIQLDETWFYNLGGLAVLINNAGTIKKTAGVGTMNIQTNLSSSGSVQGNSGTLMFAGDTTNNSSGNFSATAGNFVGFGQGVTGIQNITGTVSGTGTFFCAGGTVNVSAPATYNNGGTLVNGGTLNLIVNGATGTLGISSGTRGGTGTLTCSGVFSWTGGSIDGGGRTTCNGGMAWAGGSKFFRNHTLDNAGNATWTLGNVQSGQGGVFNNTATGVFDIQVDETWFFNLGGSAISVNNAGVFKKTVGAGTNNLQLAQFNNSGSTQGNSGTLNIGGLATSNSSGGFSATAGNFVGFTQDVAAIQNVTGPISGAGTFFAAGGTVNVNSPATWSNGGMLVNGGTLNLNVNGTTGTLGISSGTRGGTGTLTCSGLFTWTGGAIDGGGRTTCNGGMSWAGGSKLFRNHTLDNAGNATWTLGNVQSGQGGVFNNTATGVFDIQVDETWFFNLGGSASNVNNAGIFKKTAGAGTNNLQLTQFSNTGAVQGNSGTVSITGQFTQTAGSTILANGNFASSLPINIQAGILGGIGTVTGNVNSSGTVRPGASPGILTISGNYTQAANAILDIELGGLTVGTQYDRLAVTGVATLDGQLRLRLINPYVPALADTFGILTYGSRVGAFSNFDAQCFGSGQFELDYGATVATITISTPLRGDMNCDCVLDDIDVLYMTTALVSPAAFTGCDILRGDFDSNGKVDGRDIQGFTALIGP